MTVRVRRSPPAAFELFTTRIAEWWPPARTFRPGHSHQVVLEPRTGGRLFERYADGDEFTIGQVLAWEPPRLVLFTWQGRWAAPTEVKVTFSVEGDQTRVDVEHAAWERLGEAGLGFRTEYANGWPAVLAAYVAAAGT
jgi:uncharacterized protein YndB with AHSA1/START domain